MQVLPWINSIDVLCGGALAAGALRSGRVDCMQSAGVRLVVPAPAASRVARPRESTTHGARAGVASAVMICRGCRRGCGLARHRRRPTPTPVLSTCRRVVVCGVLQVERWCDRITVCVSAAPAGGAGRLSHRVPRVGTGTGTVARGPGYTPVRAVSRDTEAGRPDTRRTFETKKTLTLDCDVRRPPTGRATTDRTCDCEGRGARAGAEPGKRERRRIIFGIIYLSNTKLNSPVPLSLTV